MSKRKFKVSTPENDTSRVSELKVSRIAGRQVYDAQLRVDVDNALKRAWDTIVDSATRGGTYFEYDVEQFDCSHIANSVYAEEALEYQDLILDLLYNYFADISESTTGLELGLDVGQVEDGFWVSWTLAPAEPTEPGVTTRSMHSKGSQ